MMKPIKELLKEFDKLNKDVPLERRKSKRIIGALPDDFIMMNQNTLDVFCAHYNIPTVKDRPFTHKGIPVFINNALIDGQIILPDKNKVKKDNYPGYEPRTDYK